MLLQLLQLVLGISIYSQIFFFWCDSLFEGFFSSAFSFLKFKNFLIAQYSKEISLAWMYRGLNS